MTTIVASFRGYNRDAMTHSAASNLLLLLMAYLLGAFPAGLLVGKMVKGIDVRDYGSGNIGASNVWRTMGPLWGIAVFLFDFCKGYIPTLLTSRIHDPIAR